MSLLALFKPNGPNGYGYRSTAELVTRGLDLAGRTYLVTGCNSGLGLETVRVLSLRGARVIAAARTLDKARGATRAMGRRITQVACELAEPASVRACIDFVKADGAAIDGLVCNAGIVGFDTLRQAHGYELQFFTNHIGHFILTTGLLDRLSPTGRVVMLSSVAHQFAPRGGIEFDNLSGEKGYSQWRAYGQSKLANLLFAKALARRFEGTGRTANAVHPGGIMTNIGRHVGPLLALAKLVEPLALKTIPQGAATQCFVATHPAVERISGAYFVDCNAALSSALSNDAALAARLWDESERIAARV